MNASYFSGQNCTSGDVLTYARYTFPYKLSTTSWTSYTGENGSNGIWCTYMKPGVKVNMTANVNATFRLSGSNGLTGVAGFTYWNGSNVSSTQTYTNTASVCTYNQSKTLTYSNITMPSSGGNPLTGAALACMCFTNTTSKNAGWTNATFTASGQIL